MAVYTVIEKHDLAELVEDLGLERLDSAHGIPQGSVNTHYLLETPRGRHLLRIDEVKTELEVKRELDLLLFLRRHGFPCPQRGQGGVESCLANSADQHEVGLGSRRHLLHAAVLHRMNWRRIQDRLGGVGDHGRGELLHLLRQEGVVLACREAEDLQPLLAAHDIQHLAAYGAGGAEDDESFLHGCASK